MSVEGQIGPRAKVTTQIHFLCRIDAAQDCAPPVDIDAVAGEHLIGRSAYRLTSKQWCIEREMAGRGAVLQRGGGGGERVVALLGSGG